MNPRPIPIIRAALLEARERVEELERELDAALVADGRRPTDGEDQPTLFQREAQSKLF